MLQLIVAFLLLSFTDKSLGVPLLHSQEAKQSSDGIIIRKSQIRQHKIATDGEQDDNWSVVVGHIDIISDKKRSTRADLENNTLQNLEESGRKQDRWRKTGRLIFAETELETKSTAESYGQKHDRVGTKQDKDWRNSEEMDTLDKIQLESRWTGVAVGDSVGQKLEKDSRKQDEDWNKKEQIGIIFDKIELEMVNTTEQKLEGRSRMQGKTWAETKLIVAPAVKMELEVRGTRTDVDESKDQVLLERVVKQDEDWREPKQEGVISDKKDLETKSQAVSTGQKLDGRSRKQDEHKETKLLGFEMNKVSDKTELGRKDTVAGKENTHQKLERRAQGSGLPRLSCPPLSWVNGPRLGRNEADVKKSSDQKLEGKGGRRWFGSRSSLGKQPKLLSETPGKEVQYNAKGPAHGDPSLALRPTHHSQIHRRQGTRKPGRSNRFKSISVPKGGGCNCQRSCESFCRYLCCCYLIQSCCDACCNSSSGGGGDCCGGGGDCCGGDPCGGGDPCAGGC